VLGPEKSYCEHRWQQLGLPHLTTVIFTSLGHSKVRELNIRNLTRVSIICVSSCFVLCYATDWTFEVKSSGNKIFKTEMLVSIGRTLQRPSQASVTFDFDFV
jgi:hypothetical protein